jgi:glycosyltransferase involved in cell wall biosynthesis
MKVWHVDTAATWRGGQNQVLLTALGQSARGDAVTVVGRAGGALESRARAAGLTVRPLSFRGDVWPPAILGLARGLARERPDVVQLHDPHAASNGLLAARLAGSPRPLVVATRRVDFPLRGPLSRRKYRGCDRVIAVSRAIAGVLAAGGIPGDRVRVVYEGVPDRAPQPGGREALLALGVPPGSPVVGNVAALTGHKDHATLLEAAAIVLRASPDARFVIVGEGPLRGELEARARESGVGGRVLFAGFRDDVDRLLPAFDVFCLSSRLEGLGTSLLDAMAFARPIVGTAAGGIPEAVEDGVTGLVVPVRDPVKLAQALQALLGDPARRRSYGEAGRCRFLAHFTAERMTDETRRVYEELP